MSYIGKSYPTYFDYRFCEEEHTLITNDEARNLFVLIDKRIKEYKFNLTEMINPERVVFFMNGTPLKALNPLGGSFNSLYNSYGIKRSLYEIMFIPCIDSYENTIYSIIPNDNRPCILMTEEDFKANITSKHTDVIKFSTKEQFRTYLNDEMKKKSFYQALKAEIDFLMRSPNHVRKYCAGTKQVVNYCSLKKFKGLPCNSNCPNYDIIITSI